MRRIIMNKNKSKPTEEDKQRKFMEEYDKLCEKHGYRVAASPQWLYRDDNTYSMQVRLVLARTDDAPTV